MNLLDLRTVLFSYIVSNAICLMVIASLWLQNRRWAREIGFWVVNYALQFIAVVLIALRGIAPDFLSIGVAGALIVGGTILLFIGLERYTARPGPQRQNAALLAAFILAQLYFTYARPSLPARNFVFSLGLLAICAQAAWLLLRRVDPDARPMVRNAGWIFAAYAAVSLLRIAIDLIVPPSVDFFRMGVYDTLVILTYQMLFIGLTFSLFLMVNRRIFSRLEEDIRARERVEAELKRSEAKFSIAFNNIPDAIVITRLLDGTIIAANNGFVRISEYAQAEAVGKTTLDLNLWTSPADRNRFADELRENGRVLNHRATFRRKSGALLTGLISGELIELEEGVCALNVIRDITDLIDAGESLRISEENYRLLFESASDAILVIGANGQVVEVNPRGCEMFGYARQEFLQRSVRDLLEPADPDRAGAAGSPDGSALESGRHRMRRSDGSRIDVEISSSRFSDGRSLAMVRDISVRKQSEDQVQAAHKTLERLLAEADRSRLALLSMLEDERAAEAEKSILNSRLQILVSAIQDLAVARDLDAVAAAVRAHARKLVGSDGITFVLRDGEHSFYVDEDAIAPLWKGRRFRLEECISGWVIQNGEPALIPDIFRDERIPHDVYRPTFVKSLAMIPIRAHLPLGAIGCYWARHYTPTEDEVRLLQTLADSAARSIENVRLLDELEERVRDRTILLESANRELEAFAYSVSHDLRGPLRAMDGFSAALLSDYPDRLDEQGRHYLNRIQEASRRMGQLISDLLSLSRITRSEFKAQKVNLSAIASEVAAGLKSQEPEREVEFTIPPNLIVEGDVQLLRILLDNLINNAFKFTGRCEQARIELGELGNENGDGKVYFVRDNGVGFDMAYADKLFAPFQRLHSMQEYPGTGIGLVTVQRIVNRHGGRIWPEAALNQGATFYFTLGGE